MIRIISPRPASIRRRGVLIAALTPVLFACNEVAPTPASMSVDPQWVTASAAAQLDASRNFRRDDQQEASTTPEIAGDLARSQAAAWIASYGPGLTPLLTEQRGEAIDASSLISCGTPYYARRVYEEVDTIHPAPFRRSYGPAWLVAFCDSRGRPAVSVDVSSYNTDVSVVGGKLVETSHIRGGEFDARGVRTNYPELPVSPERAVCIAFRATGRRVADRPILHRPQAGVFASDARWKIVLEDSITVQTVDSSIVVRTNELWIGHANMATAADIAIGRGLLPAFVKQYTVLDSTGRPLPTQEFEVRPRPGRSRWAQVSIVDGSEWSSCLV